MKSRKKRSQSQKPKCYSCAYRGTIPGDAHTRCLHPEVSATEGQSKIVSSLLMLFGSRLRNTALPQKIGSVQVKLDPHGVNNGWACWPFNFDPVWLEDCTGFKRGKKHG